MWLLTKTLSELIKLMMMTMKEWTILSHFGDDEDGDDDGDDDHDDDDDDESGGDDDDEDDNKGVDYVTTFWPVRSSCQSAVSS